MGLSNLKERLSSFVKLGQELTRLMNEESNGLDETRWEVVRRQSVYYNPWFTPENVDQAMRAILPWLEEEALTAWTDSYPQDWTATDQKVAVIMAGNLPLVNFHDMLAVLISGKRLIAKLSSKDKILPRFVADLLIEIDADWSGRIFLTEERIMKPDAVIATGSDNSSRYFEQYFGKYPNVIRRNRTSVAVLNGEESKEDLFKLGGDILSYYGMGCRNVSKLLVPSGYNFNKFFESIVEWGGVASSNKYLNNYEYHRTLYLLEQEKDLLDNNFLMLKRDSGLHSPISVLFWEDYSTSSDVELYLESNRDQIQAVVGKNYLPFGSAQCPSLTDYPDGVDVMEFLRVI